MELLSDETFISSEFYKSLNDYSEQDKQESIFLALKEKNILINIFKLIPN